tara:strand:- start:62 stop:283 length:222 start_codon:yes stop_codon:yes gene_type:complete
MQRIEMNVITGEKTVVDLSAAEIAALPTPVLPTYQELRAAAYPSIADQLDTIYHKGIDAWKATITAVKEEFPK